MSLNRPNPFLKQPESDFDKTFDRVSKGIVVAWIAMALASLGITAAVIWGVVQIVQAVTS